MKLANLKSIATKAAVTAALLAGALTFAAPAKADAQVFVRVGPRPAPYYAYGYPAYYGRPGYYVAPRHDAWVRAHDRFYYDRRRW